MKDLVSIITPTYNCGRFIAETIRSVQAQTYTDWEMLIVDDCSTDDTESVVAGFIAADSRIHYIQNDRNSGAALTRNRALREARGRWIAFLDSDDLWLPEKLERQIAFMLEHGYHFSYHEYVEVDESSHELGIHVSGIRRVGRLGMYTCCWPGCLSVMYDRSVVGLVQINDVKKDNDSLMWLHVITHADCHLMPEVQAKYRRRQGSITPPGLFKRTWAHYTLFHDGAGMPSFPSFFWMCMNTIGFAYKKLCFVKKYDTSTIAY